MKERLVHVFRWIPWEPGTERKKEIYCDGIFHRFGVDYEEFEVGSGNYSTAVVELESGEVLNHPVEMIQFIEPHPLLKDLEKN